MVCSLRSLAVSILGLQFLAGSVTCADPIDAQALFTRIREQVNATVHNAPRFTCTENINRSWFRNRQRQKPECDSDRARDNAGHNLVRTDRLRLDVAVAAGQEIFGWHGEHSFRTDEVDQLVSSGPISSGTYFSFLSSIFLEGASRIYFLDLRTENGQQIATYGYSVSIEKSKFETRSGAGTGVMGYHGSFAADAKTGALMKLQIITDTMPLDVSWICSFSLQVTYSEIVLNGISFQIPAEVLMDVVDSNREHTQTVTRYNGCQEFLGQSVLRFGDGPAPASNSVQIAAPQKLPSNLRLIVRIRSLVNPATAWAGDPVEGELTAPLITPEGRQIAPKGALVRGRLLRMEKWREPARFYTAMIEFDEMQAAGVDYELNLTNIKEPVAMDPQRASMEQRLELENPRSPTTRMRVTSV